MMKTYGIAEAAAIVKIHPDTMRKMAAKGIVPGTKVGRAWIFPCHMFDAWIEERCRPRGEKEDHT